MTRTTRFTVEDAAHFSQYFTPLVYDPSATRSLHLQAGGFFWSDEMPEFVDDDYPASLRHFFMYLLAYRANLMYGKTVEAFTPLWDQLAQRCPSWPGFRSERRAASLISELEAEIDRELARLERMIRICERQRQRHRKDP